MTTTVSLNIAALSIDCADPAPRGPLNEIKLPAVPAGGVTFSVSQTAFADPEGNQFDLVRWQQQPE